MKTIISFLLVSLSLYAFSQNDGSHKRATDFRLKDGIYMSFRQVHQNRPIAKEDIITEGKEHLCFYKELFRHEFITYSNAQAELQRIHTDSILGYAVDGAFYLFSNNDHIRLNMDGMIAFVGIHPVWEERTKEIPSTNSRSENNNILGRNILPRLYTNDDFFGMQTYPASLVGLMPEIDEEPKTAYEFLIDFENDSIFDFSTKSLTHILERDPILYKEYCSLSKSNREKMMVVYLRRYNDRHPFVKAREERDVVGF